MLSPQGYNYEDEPLNTNPFWDEEDPVATLTASASVDDHTGTPEVRVTKTYDPIHEVYNVDFAFKNLKGADGADGHDGADGATGPQGPAGPQGPQGPEGPAGSDGADGATGPQGPAGPQGPQGPEGPQGPAGADGSDGETGPQGPQGPTGPQGPQGPQGPAGVGVYAKVELTNVIPTKVRGNLVRYGIDPNDANEVLFGMIGLLMEGSQIYSNTFASDNSALLTAMQNAAGAIKMATNTKTTSSRVTVEDIYAFDFVNPQGENSWAHDIRVKTDISLTAYEWSSDTGMNTYQVTAPKEIYIAAHNMKLKHTVVTSTSDESVISDDWILYIEDVWSRMQTATISGYKNHINYAEFSCSVNFPT